MQGCLSFAFTTWHSKAMPGKGPFALHSKCYARLDSFAIPVTPLTLHSMNMLCKVSTHFINKATGSVRFTANIGELFYFENRKVSIVTSPSNNKMLSPIVADFTYYITNAVTFSGNSAWNPNYCSFQNGALAMRYKPDENRLVNVGLSYKIPNNIVFNTMPYNKNDELKQISISGSWPISSKLSTLGALNYNINNKYAQTYLLGLEYNTCCWALRAVTARNYLFLNTQNRPTYDTSYHIQFVLKGLTSLDSNHGSGLLANNIPGYTNKL
jgi:LPS-assembly protein